MNFKEVKVGNYLHWSNQSVIIEVEFYHLREFALYEKAKELYKPIRLTNEMSIKLGFKEINHFTVGNTLILDVGRNRQLSFSNIGTPNEMLFLNQINDKDSKKVDDLICIHNFDYDGYLHVHELQNICAVFKVELSL